MQRLIDNKRPTQTVEDSAFGFVSDDQDESSDKASPLPEPDAVGMTKAPYHDEDKDPYMAQIEAMERKMEKYTPTKV